MAPIHGRPSHYLETPRLILRTATPSDAKQFSIVRIDPLNNPFGGVVGADRPESEQAERLRFQEESTTRGDNGFMVIILKPDQTPDSAEVLKVHDGWLIGMSGYNSFPVKPINGVDLHVGDIGALIDHRFARKGYALEALEGLIEHGFQEMGLGGMFMETNADNEPFKGLMSVMELDGVREYCSDDGSFTYTLGKQKWDTVKSVLMKKGKWLLR
ncbi:hypothetical protein DL98DRAFT_657691 [Cadophora sp. DSE1049]|nr:hypothetical protein DL98DRAFT_657691 [Cadophora sp. DSE1049]